MAKSYSSFVAGKSKVSSSTPINKPIPGKEKEMILNNTGSYVFNIGSWKQLDRFLILGCEGPTYYASQEKLVKDNAKAVQECIKKDGIRTVNRIVEVSQNGLAAKQDPGLFALALCATFGNEETKAAANAALPKVARTGTSLFTYSGYINDLRGWGSGIKKSIANWFNSKTTESLAYQVVKYRQRNGWSMRDVLRLGHVKPKSDQYNNIFKYVVKGWDKDQIASKPDEKSLQIIWASEKAKYSTDENEIARLVRDYNLPWEAIPTSFLNSHAVWESLFEDIKPEALMRNLGKLTSNGFLKPLSNNVKTVVSKLTDQESLISSRLHPLKLLVALKTYQQGHGDKGSLSWTPISQISSALEEAYYLAFKSVKPANKNSMLALDISSSMGSGEIAGMTGISPRIASAAMSMVTARTEPSYHFVGFSHELIPLNINDKMSLDQVIKNISNLNFGSTNISLPFHYARKHKLNVENFVIYTDNENNTSGGFFGHSKNDANHPWEAFKQYRQATGIDAKLTVVGMTATNCSVAAQCEPDTALDVVGFSTDSPNIISSFARGEL